jgi:hypothetical protein
VLMSDATLGREFSVKESSKAPEGAATGAATGGILGAIIAGLTAVGSVVVPGVGLLAAGPIVAALAGAGAGGAAGGLVGALVGAGLPEHEAKVYTEHVEKHAILVGVHVDDKHAGVAREILRAEGATKVRNQRAEDVQQTEYRR